MLTACVLVAGFLILARPVIDASPFSYDEADYMYAAGRGFRSNYLDDPAQSFAGFLRAGLSRGKNADEKAALSQAIRDSGDINFYRHWHGPLYFYWLILLQPFRGNEHTMRALSLLFPVLAILAIYSGSIWAFGGKRAHYAGFLAAAMYGWSVVATGSSELAPHELFVLVSISGLFLLAKFLDCEGPDHAKRVLWYGAVILSALAVATLEVGLILVLTLAAAAYWNRHRIGADWRFARNSVLLLLLSVFVIWPGALLKLAFLKAYIFMAYLAVARKAAWGATFSQAWSARLLLAPVEWLLLAAAIVLYFRVRDTRDRRAVPFLFFGTLMLLFLGRVNSPGARYMLPFLPIFDVFTAVTVVNGLSGRRSFLIPGLIGTACAALLANTLRIEINRLHNVPDTRSTELLSQIRSGNLTKKKLLVPHEDFPLLHYYFPQARFIAYGEDSEGPPPGVTADAVVSVGNPVRIATN